MKEGINLDTNNNANILNLHTDGDFEYYSVAVLDELGDVEQYIWQKDFDENEENQDLIKVCELFELNYNRALAIGKFDNESIEISSIKDVEPKCFTMADPNVCSITTNLRKVPLIIKSKQIVNVIIYDPIKKVSALAAVSMRQTLDKSLKELILKLNIKYNINPMDLKIGMISFGNSKVEVNGDTLEVFKNNFHNISHCISKTENDITNLDICKINVATLLEVGAKYENIIIIKNEDLPEALRMDEYVYVVINIK